MDMLYDIASAITHEVKFKASSRQGHVCFTVRNMISSIRDIYGYGNMKKVIYTDTLKSAI